MRAMLWITGALVLGGTRTVSAQAADGQALYKENCRTCHGADGHPTKRALGQYPKIPTFDAAFFTARSEDSVVAVLKHGAGKDMKSFKDKLSPEEMLAVARYARTLAGAAPKQP